MSVARLVCIILFAFLGALHLGVALIGLWDWRKVPRTGLGLGLAMISLGLLWIATAFTLGLGV